MIEKLTKEERSYAKGYAGAAGSQVALLLGKLLSIVDAQAERIAWLEGMVNLWRCPVHGEFEAGSLYDGKGHDRCEHQCERVRAGESG